MAYQQDFGFQWFSNIGLDSDDVFARTPRPRPPRPDRPDRPTPGGGGDDGGGSTPAGTYISGDPAVADTNEFNIQITFKGTWTTDLRNAFIVAAEAISDFILGDLPSVGARRNAVDDIVITASLVNIDGPGNVLGQAGPDAFRAGSYLPYRGSMEFDTADATVYQAVGLFDDIVLHEMLHTIGYGTIWDALHLLTGGTFNGALANTVYPGAALIPVETNGGGGTAYSHWDDDTFTNELMTGYIDDDNYLSYMTIASLGDLGYTVVSGANYTPPSFI